MENWSMDVKREFCDVDLVPSLHGGLLAEENDDRCDDEGGTQNCQEGKKPQWYLLSLKMDRSSSATQAGKSPGTAGKKA